MAHGGQAGTAEATVKGKKVTITYGRPSLKGRDLFGKAPVGTVWRLGRNEATTIESTGDLVVAGKELKAGKYTLWAKKTGDNAWVLAFHPTTTRPDGRPLWGMPELREGYVAELPLSPGTAPGAAEELAIHLDEQNGKAVVKVHWGTTLYSGSFDVK
jgi:hypothetical protein